MYLFMVYYLVSAEKMKRHVITIFMPQTSKKLRGHIGFILSVGPSVRYAFLRTRYLKNHLRYEVDIWYTISWPYEGVLINVWAECTKHCQSYFPYLWKFCYAFLQTRYLKNHLRYEVDTWYTVSRPYGNVLITFGRVHQILPELFSFFMKCPLHFLDIQYPYHMKMCCLTFGRSASDIARVIFLFMKIKCLLYLGNQFV